MLEVNATSGHFNLIMVCIVDLTPALNEVQI
jgi:hypothetical protein